MRRTRLAVMLSLVTAITFVVATASLVLDGRYRDDDGDMVADAPKG